MVTEVGVGAGLGEGIETKGVSLTGTAETANNERGNEVICRAREVRLEKFGK